VFFSSNKNEFVLHTAILRKRSEGGEFDAIAILTSKRLIILEHLFRGKGAIFKKKWEANLDQLAPPSIENAEGDAALVLNLSLLGPNVNLPNRRGSFLNELPEKRRNSTVGLMENKTRHSIFKFKGNYMGDHIILNLFNCINTLLGEKEFRKMDMSFLNICFEDEYGIRHLGPWQYSRETNPHNKDLQADLQKEKDKIIRNLKFEQWHFSGDTNAENRPQWLIQEEEQAISDQNRLRDIYLEYQLFEKEFAKTSNRERLEDTLLALRTRKISIEEFRSLVAEARQFSNEDDQSLTTTLNDQKPKKPILSSALKRFSFLGGLSRRATQPVKLETKIDDNVLDDESTPNQTIESEVLREKLTQSGKEILLSDSNDFRQTLENHVPFASPIPDYSRLNESKSSSFSSSTALKFPASNYSEKRPQRPVSSTYRIFNDLFPLDKPEEKEEVEETAPVVEVSTDVQGDPYDIFPNYDCFEGDFDENGNLFEKRFNHPADVANKEETPPEYQVEHEILSKTPSRYDLLSFLSFES
jgi:hypothetical protein